MDFDPISLWNGRRRGEILGQRMESVVAGVLWLKKGGQFFGRRFSFSFPGLGWAFSVFVWESVLQRHPQNGAALLWKEEREGGFFLLCNGLREILIPSWCKLVVSTPLMSCHRTNNPPKSWSIRRSWGVTFPNSMEVAAFCLWGTKPGIFFLVFVSLPALGFQTELQNSPQKRWVVVHPHPDTASKSDFLKPCQLVAPDDSFVMPVTFILMHQLSVIPCVFYCLPCLWVMMLA